MATSPGSPRKKFLGEPVWIADGEALWLPATVEQRVEAEDGSVEFEVRDGRGDLARVPQSEVLPRNVFKDSRGVLDVHDLIARLAASLRRARARARGGVGGTAAARARGA